MSQNAANANQNNSDGSLVSLTPAPTNKLQAQALEIRAHRVNWQSYLQGQMIQPHEFEIIRELDLAQTPDARREILDRRGDECGRAFLSLMTKISKEQTVRYVLTMVDDLLEEGRGGKIRLFCSSNNKKLSSPWIGFMNMLNRNDKFIVHQASRIIAKLACWGNERMSSQDITYYLNWIKTQLSNEKIRFFHSCIGKDPEEMLQVAVTDSVQSILSCLQMILRVKEYRKAFHDMDGMISLLALLNTRCGFQVQYQTIVCMWLMSFSPEISTDMARYNPVPVLAVILGEAAKEKVTRIVLATFRNLVTTPEDQDVVKIYSLAMIHSKVLKNLEILEAKQFADEDISNDVEFLCQHLTTCVQEVSSFDEYCAELKSQRLEWSPVHKSEKFWRENATRFNEKNYQLLKMLAAILVNSQEPEILAVAAHDIGEYVRHYPRGKKVIEQLGLKQTVMKMMCHDNAVVKYNALIAVQKLMVHNWEYLGRQLEGGE